MYSGQLENLKEIYGNNLPAMFNGNRSHDLFILRGTGDFNDT